MDWLIALLTLTAMEIVLGIDNVVFIAVVAGRLPAGQQARARRLGLGLALGTRLLLLFALSWMLGLTRPVFALSDLGVPASWLPAATNEVSWRDLILIAGGLFLIGKSTFEIHATLEESAAPAPRGGAHLGWALVQIAVLDVIFSLDSVITAVGMARQLWVMAAAMILAVGVMLAFAGPVSDFVHRHPTLKMLALSFLILIGVMLVAEGIDKHIEHGYIYFAMVFALAVELLNLRLRKRPAADRAPRPPTPPPGGGAQPLRAGSEPPR
jgi:predicted tellurium resistance membrane protein TerC